MLQAADWPRFCERLAHVAAHGGEPEHFPLAIGPAMEPREFSWYLRRFSAGMKRRHDLVVAVGRDVTSLLRERTQKVRLEAELATAQIVQTSFLPPARVTVPGLSFASFYQPAERCSGDWWGRFSLHGGLELICIGDVTGHGAGAAFLTAVAHACCTTLASLIATQNHALVRSPAQVLALLNAAVFAASHEVLFMTMFAAIVDAPAGVLRYANAGHPFPLLLPARADDARLLPAARKPWLSLAATGVPLGCHTTDGYDEQATPLRPGDRLVLYTDGLVENPAPNGVPWGRRRFVDSLTRHAGGNGVAVHAGLLADARAYYAQAHAADDLTLVVAEAT